jgi:hypothetical protein
MRLPNYNNFPVESLPPKIKNAVLEMRTNAGFPLPLIASSALGAIAASCQNSIDVELPFGSRTPVSLFVILIAESGEGKSPSDRWFMQPIRDFEENQAKQSGVAIARHNASQSSWETELKVVQFAIKKKLKEKVVTDEPERIRQLNLELEKLQQKLENHFSREPQQQPQYKIFHGNTTPGKIALDLSENVPTAYLSSDEGGSLFRSQVMKDLGMFNQIWDGSPLQFDRLRSPSFQVKNPRLTIFVAVQGEVLQDFLTGRGKGSRANGFIPRCLIAFPYSTKGSRMVGDRPQFSEHLSIFQQRITDILVQDKLELDQGRKERSIVKFSEEAKKYWFDFRNSVEYDLNPGRHLSDIDDFASKIVSNLARIAALFHFFEGQEGDISLATIRQAGAVCNWYINEFKRLFSKTPGIPLEVSDVVDLEQFLQGWCLKYPGQPCILKSLIAQYGPNQLRPASNKGRREHAINALVMQGKIYLVLQGKKKIIQLNPQHFPIHGFVQPYQPLMGY